jgi:Na+/H+ antiporter NhaD/arsenite permease-like protein
MAGQGHRLSHSVFLDTVLVCRKPQERKQLTVVHALTQIDLSSIVFFRGILLAIATLEHTQVLATLAAWLDQTIGRTDVIVLALGLISAIIDNVPLVAASMGMYGIAQFPPDSFSGNSLRTARAQAGRY